MQQNSQILSTNCII